ncbi:MAG: YfhO family protein, partial [Actinomycetaceae bacterium]|nr:YfhO family protein [Actinomycetaceae bacterium]
VCALKVMGASAVMAVYLYKRFQGSMPNAIVISLSVAYACGQWTMQNIVNIMWLDILYLFPVMAWGVYIFIHKGKKTILIVSIALSLIINFYIGAISLLLLGVWFLFEGALALVTYQGKRLIISVKKTIHAVGIVAVSVLMSAWVIIPSFLILQRGRKNTSEDIEFVFTYSLSDFFSRYTSGALYDTQHIGYYAGSLLILLFVSLFFYGIYAKKKQTKIYITIAAVMSVLVMLMVAWRPFIYLIYLGSAPHGFDGRYSFFLTFFCVFGASLFMMFVRNDMNVVKVATDVQRYCATHWRMVIYSFGFFLLSYVYYTWDNVVYGGKHVRFTLLTLCLTFVVIYAYMRFSRLLMRTALAFMIVGLTIVELSYSGLFIIRSFGSADAMYTNHFSLVNGVEGNVQRVKNEQIDAEKNESAFPVRIATLESPYFYDYSQYWRANQSLDFGFTGLSGYTSLANSSLIALYERTGYIAGSGVLVRMHQPLISLFSLMGVSHILTNRDTIEGTNKVESSAVVDGSSLFSNPYAFPTVMSVPRGNENAFGNVNDGIKNPFSAHEVLMSRLFGRDIHIYHPLDVSMYTDGNTVTYTIDDLSPGASVYGALPWRGKEEGARAEGRLEINGIAYPYGGYAEGIYAFYAEADSTGKAQVILRTEHADMYEDPLFYSLDLQQLGQLCREARAKQIDNVSYENERLEAHVQVDEDSYVYVAMSYNESMSVKVNGKEVTPSFLDETHSLMLIPVSQGDNAVVVEYSLPGLKISLLVSLCTVMCLIVYYNKASVFKVFTKIRRKKRGNDANRFSCSML